MLLGRLPVPLYDPIKSHPVFQERPSICTIGDRVKIVPITQEEYEEIEGNFGKYEYSVQPDVFEFELRGDAGV
jgi:allophanate hydrolase subunit 1